MNKTLVKDALILFAITAVAGLLLGAVYAITSGPIEKQQQKQKEAAYKEVFADAQSFDTYDASDAVSVLEAGGYSETEVTLEEVMTAKKADETVGYVMTIVDHEGYGGDIELVVGIQKDGTVNGISFLSISETAGLGMKAKEAEFMDQFAGKQVDAFVYTKTGKTSANEIDALTGATITTSAVTNAVNACICYFQSIEGGGSNE